MTDSEKGSGRRRTAAETDTGELPEGELPVERLLGFEAEALVGAPGHEVAGALALAGIDKESVTKEEVAAALKKYRSHVPNDSTNPPEDQEA